MHDDSEALETADGPLPDEVPSGKTETPEAKPDAAAEAKDAKAAEDGGEKEETSASDAGEEKPGADNADDAGAKPGKKKINPVQKRINELTYQAREAERERDYWRQQAMRGTPQERPEAQEPEPKVESDLAPEATKYELGEHDPKFIRDLARWEARQEYEARDKLAREQEEQRKIAAVSEERAAKVRAMISEGMGTYEDYAEVALRRDLKVSQTMADVIADSEVGLHVLYYLGQHPETAARIASLDDRRQAYEIGRVEAAVLAQQQEAEGEDSDDDRGDEPEATPAPKPKPKPVKKLTAAPPPGRTVGGRSKGEPDPRNMGYEEYRAWRERKSGT